MYQSLDLFILAIVAGFIIYKLYNVLGYGDEEHLTKENSKRKIINLFPVENLNKEEKIDIINKNEMNLSDELKDSINEIKSIDRNFKEHKFLNGAVKAFELIIKAYSEDDKETLKKFLSKEVLKDFCSDIDQRKEKNEILDKTLVAIVSSDIINIVLENKKIANISVKFISQQINLIKDHQGNIIKGDGSEIDNISEIWTFSKNITLSNPMWKLIETKSI